MAEVKYIGQDKWVYKTLFGVLLPTECCSCEKWFRYERMWHFVHGPYYNGFGRRSHMCFRCAKTKLEVLAKYEIARKRKLGKPPKLYGQCSSKVDKND